MTKKEKEKITFRWKGLCDYRMALAKYDPSIANAELFFQTKLLGAESYLDADELLRKLEACDEEAQELYEQEKRARFVHEMEDRAKEYLTDTIWAMLSDAPLSQEGRALYRKYRQYLRDVVQLWDNKQILDSKVMTFDEWRENPPIYKPEKKVIL
jgi:hypothetical protein